MRECYGHRHHHGPGDWPWCGHEGRRHGFPFRRFLTREERVALLEEYLEELRKEVKAVEQHIAEMKEA